MPNNTFGNKRVNWKGRKIKQGRIFIRVGINKDMLESRVKMEKKIGRRLKTEEVVHHKDHNKLNNNISNLMLLKNCKEHSRQHAKERVLNIGGNPNKQKICYKCQELLLKENFHKDKWTWDGLTGICKECRKNKFNK